ncbi:MAG: hypothetical protein Q7S83_01410 [bacterium]|nr:hypothetical protein [bacterium]
MSIQSIIDLIKGGKAPEAGKQLADYVADAKISPEDRGSVYAEVASAYLKTNSDKMREYKEFLEEVKGELRELNLKEKILTDGS